MLTILPVPGPKNTAAPLNSGSELGRLPFPAKHERHARGSFFNIFLPAENTWISKHTSPMDTSARDTEHALQSTINSRAGTHFLKIVTRKCEHKTGERAPRPGSVLTRCPQKGNLPHIREEWSKYHLHTALYHRRKTNRNAKHGSQHEFPFKNSRSTRGTVPNCGWR